MKQTNNAIKFLLAQYRAIFKQAYLKGLVSAVVLTTGLAAGAANAAVADFGDAASDATKSQVIDATSDKLTVSVSGANTTALLGTLDIQSGSATDNTITAGAADAKINSGAAAGKILIGADTGLSLLASGGGAGNLTAQIAEIESAGTLVLGATNSGTVTLNATTVTLSDTAVLNVNAATGKTATVSGSSWSLNNAVINLKGTDAAATVRGALSQGSSATINVTGANDVIDYNTSGKNTATLNVNVAKDASGSMQFSQSAKTLNLVDSIFDVKGNLTITSGSVTLSGSSSVNLDDGAELTIKTSTDAATLDTTSLSLNNATVNLSGGGASKEASIAGQLTNGSTGAINSNASGTFVKLYTAEGESANVALNVTAGTATISLEGEGKDTLKLSGTDADITVDGVLAIEKGTLDLSGVNSLTSAQTFSAGKSGEVSVGSSGNLIVDVAKLNKFLTTDSTSGGMSLAASGTLTLTSTSADPINLSELAFSGNTTSVAGKINAKDSGAVIKGESLSIEGNVADATNFDVYADNFTVGKKGESSSITSSFNSINVAQELKFTGKGDLTVSGSFNLDTDATEGGLISSELGSKAVILSGSTINVNKGAWTADANINLGTSAASGTIKVSAPTEDGAVSTLTFGEGSKLTLVSGSATAEGEGAVLDFAEGSLAYDATTKASATLGAYDGATVNVSAKDLSSALNTDGSQFTLSVSGENSTANVDGDLTVKGGQFVASANPGILVDAGSTLNLTGKLTVNGADENNGISLTGLTGTVSSNVLSFSGDASKALTVTGSPDKTTLEVKSALNSTSDLTVSNLNLNLAGTAGKITSNLTAGTGANVTVTGAWNASGKEIKADGGNFVVANSGSLTADKIAATSNGFTVNEGGLLTVNGVVTGDKESDPKAGEDGYYGFSLTGTTVTVDGGKFVIGANGAAGIYANQKDWQHTEADLDNGVEAKDVLANFGEYALSNAGVLEIQFASGDSLTLDQLATLKNELAGGVDGSLSDGALKIGSATITGITGEGGIINNGVVDYDDYKDVASSISDIQQDEFMEAQVVNVTNEFYGGHVGSIKLASGVPETTIQNNTTLNKADGNGYLISNSNGTAAGNAVISSGTDLALQGNGNVGKITLNSGLADDDQTTFNINATNKVDSIVVADGATNTKVVVGASGDATVANGITGVTVLENNNKLTVASGSITGNTTLTNNGTLTVASGSVDTTGLLTNNGTLSASGNITAGKFADTADSVTTAESVAINGKSTVSGTVNVTKSFSLSGEYDSVADTVDASVVAGTINAKDATVSLTNTNVATTGAVTAKETTLSGLVDIDGQFDVSTTTRIATDTLVHFNHNASVGDVVIADITNGNYPTGVLINDIPGLSVENGALVVAKTITGAAGTDVNVGDEDTPAEGRFANGYLEVTDQLTLNGSTLGAGTSYDQKAAFAAVGRLSGVKSKNSVGILDGDIELRNNAAIGVGVTLAELQAKMAQFMVDGAFQDPVDNDSYGAMLYFDRPVTIANGSSIILGEKGNTFVGDNTIYFGEATALAVNTDNAKDDGSAYITFNTVSNNEGIETMAEGEAGEEPTTSGKLIGAGGDIVLFGDTYKKSYKLFDEATVKTLADGTSIDVISANGFLEGSLDNTSDGSIKLDINEEKAGVFLASASSPVQASLIAYIRGYNGDAASFEEAADADKLYYGTTKVEVPVQDENAKATSNTTETTTTVVPNYDAYNNYFLSQVVLGGNAADAEKVARLGVYGGTAQAALTAGATTYEAVAGRMGVGAQNGNITFADNGQGAGLWVTPVYKNHDSDGFGAQGMTYGADLDLYGVALGADYTLENGLRVGAAFNVGSGDADGQGAGAGVSNDFDYYGFTVYGGFTMDQLSVVADVSYTAVDNDVEANTGVEKISASMDSTNLSFGVTAQYAFNMNGVSVTPHAGLRYTNIDLDDYTVRGSADIAKYSADSASVFSIPVGVTFAKEITSGAWTIKPALDLTLTANMGDDSVDGSVTWAGVENLKTNLESEVIDSFTYGAALGVSAKSGNMSFGFGVNYTGASSADEYGVSANARFVF